MKKGYVLTALVSLIIVAGVVGFVVVSGNKPAPAEHSHTEADHDDDLSTDYTVRKACDALTLAEAKTLLGNDATLGSNAPGASTKDMEVTNCSYTNNDTTVSDIRVVTVLIRSAKNAAGAESNDSGFHEAMAPEQKVSGYGHHAYFAQGQLNIHSLNNWIIVSMGGTNPAKNTLEDAKLAADQVMN